MTIYEITIDGETFISTESVINFPVNTELLESNIWGLRTFLRNEFYYHFSLDGPIPVSKEYIAEILGRGEK